MQFQTDEADLLSSANIGHLRILLQMLTLESVTATANANNLPQSSASRTLAKMRNIFDDPLLVRNGDKMVATERGAEIRQSLADLIEKLDNIAVGGAEFQPQKLTRQFKFALADSVMISLVPMLISKINSAGPGLIATIRSIEPDYDIVKALASGDLDIVIDAVSSSGDREDIAQLKSIILYDDDVVLMARRDHPIMKAGKVDLDDYLKLKHLAPHSYYRPNLGPIDGVLWEAKLRRNIHAFVPEFSLVPSVLMKSDFVFTTSRRFADYFAAIMPIGVMDAPSLFTPIRFRMLWHERSHHSPAGIWLRNIVKQCADEKKQQS